jgi:hypothetical protein
MEDDFQLIGEDLGSVLCLATRAARLKAAAEFAFGRPLACS